jgi:hypothetical protein
VDCVFLFTHEKHSTRQYMLKVLSRYKTQSAANTQLSAPRFLPLCQHHLVTTLKTIRPIKSRKRDIICLFVLFVCFQVFLTDETRCYSESKIDYLLNVVRKFQIKCCP